MKHLKYTTTDRGFDRMPPIPSEYPGGSVQVYESSAASGPHIWLNAIAPEGGDEEWLQTYGGNDS